jgi:hypothetical protein
MLSIIVLPFRESDLAFIQTDESGRVNVREAVAVDTRSGNYLPITFVESNPLGDDVIPELINQHNFGTPLFAKYDSVLVFKFLVPVLGRDSVSTTAVAVHAYRLEYTECGSPHTRVEFAIPGEHEPAVDDCRVDLGLSEIPTTLVDEVFPASEVNLGELDVRFHVYSFVSLF